MNKTLRRLATRITERWPSLYWRIPVLGRWAYHRRTAGLVVSMADFTEAMKTSGAFERMAEVLARPSPLIDELSARVRAPGGRTMEIPLGGDCECEPDAPTYNNDAWKPTHFLRVCLYCSERWEGLHCPHDRYQNRCPNCGQVPEAV